MPLIQLNEINTGAQVGLWRISEKAEHLIDCLQLSKQELEMIRAFQSGKRYLHWLASRVLLRTMLKTKRYIHMQMGSNGQPLILNFPFQVSISHSHDMAAVVIADRGQVGVDVELIQAKIMKLFPKFLSNAEINILGNALNPQNVCIAWCAKEVMFKAYAKGGIDFKSVLSLDVKHLQKEGLLKGCLSKGNLRYEYDIHYRIIDHYVLAYTSNRDL